MSHEITDKDIETLINNGVKVQVKAETINKSAIGGVNLVKLFNDVESIFDKFELKLKIIH
ncbi:MAG: hypothetical protein K6G31_04510 [Paludibacteraceae bacterium]|nr:hypothetical protein [Paludibacteraceae bacterium]